MRMWYSSSLLRRSRGGLLFMLPRVHPTQHPASAAEDAHFRARVRFRSSRRLERLEQGARRAQANRAKEELVGALFPRLRMEADLQSQRRMAEVAALISPRFIDQRMPIQPPTSMCGEQRHPPAALAETPHAALAGQMQTRTPKPKPMPMPMPMPPQSGSPRSGLRRRKTDVAEIALTSAQTVRAVLDIFYDKMFAETEAAYCARHRDAPGATAPSLTQCAKAYVDKSQTADPRRLADAMIPNGLLGLRIGCAECDPHPTVILFQRLMGWKDGRPSEESALPLSQRQSLWLLYTWLLPTKERMKAAVAVQLAERGQKKPTRGAAPRYEPMPPRTTTSYSAVGQTLDMLKERRLLDGRIHSHSLGQAARGLKERRRRNAEGDGDAREIVVDAEELILYWMEIWQDWRREQNRKLGTEPV